MKCTECGANIILQCNDDEPYKISGKPVCRNCYFQKLGETIELYPIGVPLYKQH